MAANENNEPGDLVSEALLESGLDLMDFKDDDAAQFDGEATDSFGGAVQQADPPLAVAAQARSQAPQIITVRAEVPGQGTTVMTNNSTHALQTSIRLDQNTIPQQNKTPLKLSIPSALLQRAASGATPVVGQLPKQTFVKKIIKAGTPGGANKILLTPANSGTNGQPKSIIVDPGAATGNTKSIILSPAGAKTEMIPRRIFVGPSTTSSNGQVVVAQAAPSQLQAQGKSVPQLLQAIGNAGNQCVLHVKSGTNPATIVVNKATTDAGTAGPLQLIQSAAGRQQATAGTIQKGPIHLVKPGIQRQATTGAVTATPLQIVSSSGGPKRAATVPISGTSVHIIQSSGDGQQTTTIPITGTPVQILSSSNGQQQTVCGAVTSDSVQILQSSRNQLQSVTQLASASVRKEKTRIIQNPSVGQLQSITGSLTGSKLIISQTGLSGGVITGPCASSPRSTTESLLRSGSGSNSPVLGLGNIPTVVSQQINSRNFGITNREGSNSKIIDELRVSSYLKSSQNMHPGGAEDEAEDAEEESEELGHAETYAEYKPRKVLFGLNHPDPVVESSSLASVEPHDVYYELSFPPAVIDQGCLSALQLEAITYTCQRHNVILPSGQRAGYLIGDGAGVGKGRTVAGIIYENYLQGRKRALWLSVSNDLKFDAERDLYDVGAKIKVFALNKFKYARLSSRENGSVKKGVVFVTYSSLIGESSQADNKYRTRIKQLLRWCGKDFDGVIVFDECHKAKNLCPTGSSKPTKTGKAVLELQNLLPNARVVYASATGASEPRNMAYMTRLGLWGEGTAFREFSDFISAVEKRGVGAMELVAMDMKLLGMYIARQLSFKDVTFKIEEIKLSSEFKVIYNRSADLWMEARGMFQKAADLIQADQTMRKSMWGQFWSAHQRFFKYLCISAKLPACVREVRRAMEENKCVVIGLQSTGEARTQEIVEEQGGELTDFVSTAKGVFQSLVEKHFPAADRRKALGMLGLSSLMTQPKRKIEHNCGPSKRARMEEEYADSRSDSDSDSSSSDLGLSDWESDNSSDLSSDVDDNPFAHGSSSDEEGFPKDGPWVSRSKSKGNKKKINNNHKKAKTKKNKKKSIDKEDEFCDKALNAIEIRKSVYGFGSGSGDVQPEQAGEKALGLKLELLKLIDRLGQILPPNPLDQLITDLGGPDVVAEMTGRKSRIVQDKDGNIVYENRSETDVSLEMMNLTEKDRFMNGEKKVAIISEAASSGISLQADRRAGNQRRRVHITLELPWSADRAIQQFGRTHRSNQVNAPQYKFLISELAGERRFAATVAKRLESLGALTQGDRRATETRDLSQFNIDNRFGRSALECMMKSVLSRQDAVVQPPKSYEGDFYEDVKQALEGVGLMNIDLSGMVSLEKDYQNISKFLNRLLGMRTDLQNALFEYFNNTLTTLILDAKRSGRWDMGILDLGSGQDVVQRLETTVFVGNTASNKANTVLSKIQVERGLSWDDAWKIWRKLKHIDEGFYLSRQERNMKHTAIMIVYQGKNKSNERVYSVYRPNTGLASRSETLEMIKKKHKKAMPDEAEMCWKDQYVESANLCIHAYWNGNCRKRNLGMKCEIGLRTRQYHVLSGSVMSVWNSVETVLSSMPGGNMTKMQIVRLKTGDGEKIVGSLIPANCVAPLVNVLSSNSANTITKQHQLSVQSAVNSLQAASFPHTPSTSASSHSNNVEMGSTSSEDKAAEDSGSSRPNGARPEKSFLSMPVFD